MHLLRSVIAAAVLAAASPAQADTVSGTPVVIDGSRMLVGGVEVTLHAVAVPQLGETCLVRSRQMDCGVLARAGLMDITAGAIVTCEPAASATHRCSSEGYDLAYGLLHAGWAVSLPGAPAHYSAKMAEARERERGLWAARGVEGNQPYALSIKR